MYRLPLVKDQLSLRTVLYDLDVAIRGLLLIEKSPELRGLDARREKDPREDDGERKRGVEAASRPQSGHRHHDQREAKAHQRGTCTEGGDEPEHRQECAEDAAGGRECVNASRRVAAGLNIFEQKPDRERADAAEQDSRPRKQQHDREQRAAYQAHAQVFETLLRGEQDRVADQRDHADPQARPRGDLVQDFLARVTVGKPAADDIAGGQVDEDEADQHAPDIEARAEVRRQQARRSELHAQGGHAGDEHERQQQPARPRGVQGVVEISYYSPTGCSAAHLRVRSSIGTGSWTRVSAYRSPGGPPFGSGRPRPRRRIFVPFCVSGGTLNCTWPPLSDGAATSPPRSAMCRGTGTTTRRSLPSRVKTGSGAIWTLARKPGTRSTVPSFTPAGTLTSTRRPPGSSTVRLVPR